MSNRIGLYSWPDGTRYEGQWHRGQRSGEGKLSICKGYNDKSQTMEGYIGQWHEDNKNGRGLEQDTNGNIWEGNFLDGEKHGFGTIFSRSIAQNKYSANSKPGHHIRKTTFNHSAAVSELQSLTHIQDHYKN